MDQRPEYSEQANLNTTDIETVANVIQAQFGDGAKVVARIQYEEAEPHSRELWRAILDQLTD